MSNIKYFFIGILTLVLFNNSLSAQKCIEKCIEECYKDERKCIENLNKIRKDCYKACEKAYPHDSDHGYYGDICKDGCDMRYEFNVGYCIIDADRCIDDCDRLGLECLNGFTFEPSSNKCVYTLPDGYTAAIIEGGIYILCDVPGPDCCPAGFDLAIDQFCTSSEFSDECSNRIRLIEINAALDEAQGNTVDWNAIADQIADIRADPNCYEDVVDPNCNICFPRILEELDLSDVTIDGQKIKVEPICL